MNQTLRIHRYGDLRAAGLRRSDIERMLRLGTLVRVWKGAYIDASLPAPIMDAVRHRGRLDCLSLLQLRGIFVLSNSRLHIHVDYGSTRVEPAQERIARHWRETTASRDDLAALVEALAQSCRCQSPRAAIATLDSAWHQGHVDEQGIAEVFARLPARFRALRPLLEPRSEAGTETFVRLLLRALGVAFEVQVVILGVGRVDFVVEGWLIIECDSEAHHGGWEAQRRDRRRDLAAARLGYTTIRPIAEDIFHHSEIVVAAIVGLLEARRVGEHNVAKRPSAARKGAAVGLRTRD